ncbi:hypothetical protein D3C75_1266920 [compost metagenome]
MMPVQRHIDGFICQQLHQDTPLKLLPNLQLRHQPPSQAGFGQADKAFGRRAQMVLEASIDPQ